MSSGPEQTAALRPWRVWRALAVVAVFTVLGPAVGGLIVSVVMLLASKAALPAADVLKAFLVLLFFSYWIAGILAFLTGALSAGLALWRQTTSWLVPIGASLAVTAFLYVSVQQGHKWTYSFGMFLPSDAPRVLLIILPLSLIAALVCWLPARRLLRP